MSERHTDGEMEGEVAAPTGMEDGIMVLVVVVGRIDRLHGTVEAEDEIAEVEAQAEAVGDGDLLEEGVELKLAAGLLGIGAKRPDMMNGLLRHHPCSQSS